MSSPTSDDAGQPTGEILISRMNMTRRQYYTRINQLRDAGLITKKRARFVLTSLGRVVYETHKTIGVAIQNRWKLEAIDSIQLANRMPTEERHKLIRCIWPNSGKRLWSNRGKRERWSGPVPKSNIHIRCRYSTGGRFDSY